ncbi:MAG: VOC family protein [Streptosporangiaceae bacterium]
MVDFYEKVTGITADRPAPVFAQLRYPSCTLALGHTRTAGLFNNAARPAHNQTAIIEFVVDDVDAEYERLKPLVSERVGAGANAHALGKSLHSVS